MSNQTRPIAPRTADAAPGCAAIAVPTSFGTLVCHQGGDAGVYDELYVDLVDGDSVRQLACVGATEPSDAEPGDVHAYVWEAHDEAPSVDVTFDVDHEEHVSAPWYDLGATSDAPDRDGFAMTLSLALATHDPMTYGWLATDPMHVMSDRACRREFLVCGDRAADVTRTSLAALGRDALRLAAHEYFGGTLSVGQAAELIRSIDAADDPS